MLHLQHRLVTEDFCRDETQVTQRQEISRRGTVSDVAQLYLHSLEDEKIRRVSC